jgi:hypothetical protein
MDWTKLFLIISVVCFILDLFNVKIGTVKLQSLGLAFGFASFLV